MKGFSLGLVLCVASAHASFDMLLLANGADNRIYRHDPVNNVSLGSFGVSGSIIDIAVDQAANEVLVLTSHVTGTGILRYDYNNGNFKSSMALGGSFGIAKKLSYTSDSELLVSYSRDVVRYGASTGVQLGIPMYYADRRFLYNGGAAFAGGYYHLLADSDGTFWTSDYVMTHSSSNGIGGVITSSTSQDVHNYADIVANAAGTSVLVSENLNANNLAFTRYGVSGSSLVNTGVSFSIAATGNVAHAMEWGHGSMAYAIYTINSGQMVVRGFETNLGLLSSFNSIAGFTNATHYRGSAIVIAPEPGSLVAIEMGALVLLRRRR